MNYNNSSQKFQSSRNFSEDGQSYVGRQRNRSRGTNFRHRSGSRPRSQRPPLSNADFLALTGSNQNKVSNNRPSPGPPLSKNKRWILIYVYFTATSQA